LEFYKNKKNVENYIRFTPSHDGSELVDVLADVLPHGSTVLELGMGPGKDFDLLGKLFEVTGSDSSQEFLDLYRARNADAELLLLDAITLDTDRRFDAIYSNKVLIHLTRDELAISFARQHDILNADGLLMHSFWHGDTGEEEYEGLRLTYYTEKDLTDLLEPDFEVVDIRRHAKMKEGDSVYVIARKKS
jgi:SAM-dependent methyltransferase